MGTPSSLKRLSFRDQFSRYFVRVLALSLLCTVITWAVSLVLLIAPHSILRPANYYEQQVPTVAAFARQNATRIVSPSFQVELEAVIPLEGIAYQVVNAHGELLYGSDAGRYFASPADLIDKLNTSERIDDRIATYHPIVDENGALMAVLVLLYRLTLLGSNPNQVLTVAIFAVANLLAPFVFIIGFTALFARSLGRRLADPIDRLIAAAERIEQHDLDFTLAPAGGSKELAQLTDAFEEMRSALHHSLEAQWQMEQERRDMLAAIVHDLQTPMTVIAGHVDNLLESREKRRERLERYLRTIRSYTQRVIRLVDDLSSLAEVDQPALALDLRPVNLRQFFESQAEQIQNRCTEADIHFELQFEAADDAPPTAIVDAARLEQILANIVENSIRFTPEGGTISLHVRPDRDHLHAEIRDTGPGFQEQDLPHVFDRFYQGRAGSSRHSGHSGLGLHIVKRLVEKHGGAVSAGSRPEGGAWVAISLPLAAPGYT